MYETTMTLYIRHDGGLSPDELRELACEAVSGELESEGGVSSITVEDGTTTLVAEE